MKIIKKKDLIHDGGVHQRGNHIDVLIVTSCTIVTLTLIVLTILAYAN